MTARDIARQNSAVPTVRRAWALRELIVRGCEELEHLLDARQPVTLRSPQPPRGGARRGVVSKTAVAGEFRKVPSLQVPRSLARRLRALVPRLGAASGTAVSLASVVRETICIGFEVRERERAEAERRAQEQRELLRLAGFGDIKFTVVGAHVVTPYSAPGRSSAGGAAESMWSQPIRLEPRAQAPVQATKKQRARKTPKAQTKVRARKKAERARASRRRAVTTTRTGTTTGGDGDDEPPPDASAGARPARQPPSAPEDCGGVSCVRKTWPRTRGMAMRYRGRP